MGTSRRLLAILPLIALAIAGCGGGGGGDSTAVAPVETTEAAAALSKEELIAQGDAICAEVNAAVGTVGSTSSAAGQEAQVAGLYGGMVERLTGLGAPSDDSVGYPEFISSAEALAQAEDEVKLASEREEGEALSEAETEASSALASFQSAATSFGFEDCAEAPAAPTPSGAGEGSGEVAEGVEEAVEEAPEEEVEPTPEAGGAGAVEEESTGGGAGAGGGTEGGGSSSGGGSSGGIGPG